MIRHTVVTVIATALAGGLGRDVARAAPDEAERQAAARQMFAQGLAAAERAAWPEAADRFARAYALRPTPEIAYDLSTAMAEMGRLVAASELLRRIAGDGGAPSAVRRAAETRLAELLPRLGALRVRVGAITPGMLPTLDGQPLEPARLDVAIPVDPGVHRLELTRAGRAAARLVSVGEGASIDVDLRDGAAAPAAMLAATPPPAEPAPPSHRRWVWVAVGAVVAGAVAAGAAALASRGGGPQGNVATWKVGP
jgi:hypothetical protein